MTEAIVQEEVTINSQQRTDRRVRRTRELLRAALLSLIEEKGYAAITVQDILDRADVGRSTFYAHFTDKEDLLRSGFDEFRSTTLAEMRPTGASPEGKVEFLEPMLFIFRHVEEHRARWKPLAGKGGAELVIRLFQEQVVDLIREHLRSQLPAMRGKRRETELEAAVQFLAGSSMGLINWWLESEIDCSAEELHSIYRGLSVQGVRRFLVSS